MAGTTFDLVVLSSSPPTASPIPASPHHGRSPRRVSMAPAASLELSTPGDTQRTLIGASKPTKRAAPIPEGAVRGFATVSSLVRSEHFAHQEEDATAIAPKARGRASKKSKTIESEAPPPKPPSRAKKATQNTDNAPDPELRLPPRKKHDAQTESATENIVAEAVPKKATSRSTKSSRTRVPKATEPQSKHFKSAQDTAEHEPDADVTEPFTKKRGAKKSQGNADVASHHFRADADAAVGETELAESNVHDVNPTKKKASRKPKPPAKARTQKLPPEDLELEEAVARRRDWTPPPQDQTTPNPPTDSIGKENKDGPSHGDFTKMMSNYAYAKSPPAQPSTKDAATETTALTKRRRVELVEIPGAQANSRNSSPEKGKAPKKKARTITDIVTEQYAPKVPVEDDAQDVGFFERHTVTAKVPLNDTTTPEVPAKKQSRARTSSKTRDDSSKGKGKVSKRSAKTAKAKPVAEKLLSPTSAGVRMSRQDVLFGTSSQLAIDGSPRTIRQIQQAMEMSEHDQGIQRSFDYLIPPRWPRLGKVEGKKGLWAASARDEEGSTLAHDDVYMPAPDRTQDIPLLMDGTVEEPACLPTIKDTHSHENAIPISSDPPMPGSPHTTQRIGNEASALPESETSFVDIDILLRDAPPSAQNADSFVDIDDLRIEPTTSTTTNFPLAMKLPPPQESTTLRTAASPVKRRKRATKPPSTKPAIANKRQTKSKPHTAEPVKLISPLSTPPRQTSRFIDIEEILDSEDEALEMLSPTPPRTRLYEDSPPLQLVTVGGNGTSKASKKASSPEKSGKDELVSVYCIPILDLQWKNLDTMTFEKITAHVRALPPSSDLENPSWYERILMYHPIVLEDFTGYLNTATDIRTYKKATQKQIKLFNQDRKEKGQAKLSVQDDEVEILAIEKDLEVWQVQAWCESMSICCIWGEGRGKGTARKGFY